MEMLKSYIQTFVVCFIIIFVVNFISVKFFDGDHRTLQRMLVFSLILSIVLFILRRNRLGKINQ
jgi:hypothetical protein